MMTVDTKKIGFIASRVREESDRIFAQLAPDQRAEIANEAIAGDLGYTTHLCVLADADVRMWRAIALRLQSLCFQEQNQ
jgi:hypothetical protein